MAVRSTVNTSPKIDLRAAHKEGTGGAATAGGVGLECCAHGSDVRAWGWFAWLGDPAAEVAVCEG